VFVSFEHNFSRINLCNLHKNGIFNKLSTIIKNDRYKLPIDGITITRAP
jgi:hypothetical protein